MAIAPTLQRHLAARPRTKREADVVALKLFCLFSFILVGLIMAGVLEGAHSEPSLRFQTDFGSIPQAADRFWRQGSLNTIGQLTVAAPGSRAPLP